MPKKLHLLLLLSFQVLVMSAGAQTVITQWNFNSNPADANTGTGLGTPSTGTGTISNIGGITNTFASGSANGGSSDPAPAADNSGYNTTAYPAASAADKTAGIQFIVSTSGYTSIRVTFDHRHSNTSSRWVLLQYTTDITATTPVWTDFESREGNAGDTWFARSFDLSSVTTLDNNPNAAFRIVSTFAPSTTSYAAANTGSTYAGGGTWRFDMVTVSGTGAGGDTNPPVAQTAGATSNTTSFIKFSEPVSSATATNLANYNVTPSLAVSGAVLSSSGDTVFLTHAALTNGQTYTLNVSGVQDAAGNTMSSANFNLLFNSSIPALVITEIIHSPNDIEMIEVYNAGATAINLGGLKWTDGTTGSFPELSLAAGATAVFATSTASASTILNVSPVYLINNGLGSSNDILVIRNSLNQVVDSVDYYVGTNGWPVAPTGVYGYSFELSSASADNNVGSNWFAPLNPVTPQPAQGIVRATPGVYPTPPFTPAGATISFSGTKTNVNETATTVTLTATIQGGGPLPSSVDIEVLPISKATGGVDYTLTASTFNWAANANNVNATITVNITNDALAEGAEYFIVRFVNPVNVNLPAASANHFTVVINDDDLTAPTASETVKLTHIASFSNGASGVNSAEIVAHDPVSQRLFIANSIGAKLDIVNFSNPASASLIASIPINAYGNINSVAVRNGIVAAAVENTVPELPGKVVFFDINGNFISQVNVGAMPDMITFNHAGTKVLTANEGQPHTDYTSDPEGSVSIIDISGGAAAVTQGNVSTADFTAFNSQEASLRLAGIRIFGANTPTVAEDMEPEYITISADDQTAWVTCQENNAIAVINLNTATVTEIRPLGTKDHNVTRNGLDISDQGSNIEIAAWPVRGVYLPDAVASFTIGGQTYLITTNEGDAREYNALTEVVRASSSSYVLDPVVFPYPEALKANIGRLNVTTASGDTDNDGDFDEIHAFGARSVSIWNATTGALVWDSGNEFELITSKHPVFGALFNASNANNTLKNRSDDKGPEPEGVVVAEINGKTYAFIALERMGGCMVYDISNPAAPLYVDYVNTRTLGSYGGDQGAEGIIYITAANSPTGQPIVILANEVSSTLSFFTVVNSVLDITLSDIRAANFGTRNRISWTTADEEQGDAFELQKSSSASNFTTLANVQANGHPSAYEYWDDQPFEGTTYYRIKLKHLSGRISYSPIVKAVKGRDSRLTLYPSPARDVLTVRTSLTATAAASIELIDMKGTVVQRIRQTDTEIRIDISQLAPGLYTVKYSNGRDIIIDRFTKL